jgi:hypothetical protein
MIISKYAVLYKENIGFSSLFSNRLKFINIIHFNMRMEELLKKNEFYHIVLMKQINLF